MNRSSRWKARQKGQTTYFTGKPCKHGHVARRKVYDGGCLDCGKKSSKCKYQQRKKDGVCTDCGKQPPKSGRTKCVECLEYLREYRQEHNDVLKRKKRRMYLQRKEKGLCYPCGKPALDSSIYCSLCKKKVLKNQKARRSQSRKTGICTNCQKNPAEVGRKTCESCLERVRQRSHAHVEMGLCRTGCRRPLLEGYTYCAYHLEKAKWMNIKSRYGLTQEDWLVLFNKQKGLCAIKGCNQIPKIVDHDHETGKVRGLLCSDHNKGLGDFHDNITELQGAIKYLRKMQQPC